MKVLVFLEENKLSPRGGPYGVGYYYYYEMKKRGDKCLSFLSGDIKSELLRKNGQKITRYFPSVLNKMQRSIRQIISIRRMFKNNNSIPTIDYSQYDIIHFHTTLDLYKERKNLENYNGIVILSSHSPIPFAQEISSEINWFVKLLIPGVQKKYEMLDTYAFDRADNIIFPCPEAEEPYCNNWDYYNIIREKKKNKYRYVTTGINSVNKLNSRKEIRMLENIPTNDFVISYVGRHNYVKGYDLLKKIGEKYLAINDDSWFLICGLESPMKGIDNLRWREIGWTTNQYSYIAASDLFILPNRETYFDLVMLEVLSLGKIVVASRTGGNKYFEKMNAEGVFLYNNVDEAIEILDRISKMSREERNILEAKNKEFFNKYLTSSIMYDNYINTLEEILETSRRVDKDKMY